MEKHLEYFRNKGARDFRTTGFGLVTDCIALDVRVMGVVSRIVPGFRAKVPPVDCEIMVSDYNFTTTRQRNCSLTPLFNMISLEN